MTVRVLPLNIDVSLAGLLHASAFHHSRFPSSLKHFQILRVPRLCLRLWSRGYFLYWFYGLSSQLQRSLASPSLSKPLDYRDGIWVWSLWREGVSGNPAFSPCVTHPFSLYPENCSFKWNSPFQGVMNSEEFPWSWILLLSVDAASGCVIL